MKEMSFKEMRLYKNMIQEKLAELSGYSKDYISMLERGERNPSNKAKAIFAKIFDVPIVQIFLVIQWTKSMISENNIKDK